MVKSELSAAAASELLLCINRDRADRNRCLAGLYERTKVERAVLLQASTTTQEGARMRV